MSKGSLNGCAGVLEAGASVLMFRLWLPRLHNHLGMHVRRQSRWAGPHWGAVDSRSQYKKGSIINRGQTNTPSITVS